MQKRLVQLSKTRGILSIVPEVLGAYEYPLQGKLAYNDSQDINREYNPLLILMPYICPKSNQSFLDQAIQLTNKLKIANQAGYLHKDIAPQNIIGDYFIDFEVQDFMFNTRKYNYPFHDKIVSGFCVSEVFFLMDKSILFFKKFLIVKKGRGISISPLLHLACNSGK